MAGLSRWIGRTVERHSEIRIRVTAAPALVTLILSSALCAMILVLVRQQWMDHTVIGLAREARKTATAINAGTLGGEPPVSEGALVQVKDNHGNVISASPRMEGREPIRYPPPPATDDRRDGKICDVDAPGGDCFLITEYRVGLGQDVVFVYALKPWPGPFPRPLIAALFMLGVPLLTGLAAVGTWAATSRALRPVEGIRRELDEITATDLERRVPQPPRRDEVGRLAESINATLDRLEKAVARQRGFVNDVSHELRSPLAALRMELELAMTAPDDVVPQETMRAILANTDRLTAVVDDLQALGRLEADRNFQREQIDLTELADQEVLSRPHRTRVTVLSEGTMTVQGGRNELARLLRNLIDNADRHAESEVTIILRREPPDTAVVEVVDDGTGIAPEDRERVFERFTRLSEGRHRDAGGTGLGLAIARDIAEAHGGTLVLADRPDNQPGARFILRLPQ
ncbi:MAG TPA: HAMP domain-containing sensor histidine kinase [Spirillospora sp.]